MRLRMDLPQTCVCLASRPCTLGGDGGTTPNLENISVVKLDFHSNGSRYQKKKVRPVCIFLWNGLYFVFKPSSSFGACFLTFLKLFRCDLHKQNLDMGTCWFPKFEVVTLFHVKEKFFLVTRDVTPPFLIKQPLTC